MDKLAMVRGLNVGALAFGVAGVLTPSQLGRAYGLASTDELVFLSRLWGSRTAAIGVLGFVTQDEELLDKMLLVGIAMNATDAVTAAVAGARGKLAPRGAAMAAAASAAFVGLGLYTRSLH
jgi:hypothetical protein